MHQYFSSSSLVISFALTLGACGGAVHEDLSETIDEAVITIPTVCLEPAPPPYFSCSEEDLHYGDVNGDGLSDRICVTSGIVQIDYASPCNPSTPFNGNRDFEADTNFCIGTTKTVYAGDYNGDGYADLLCHDHSDGSMWIDYRESDIFSITDWQYVASGWCETDAAVDRDVHIADFNGDGRDDFLCHRRSTGAIHIDFASSLGRFLGADHVRPGSFCGDGDRDFVIGDFNGDGRADLGCHSPNAPDIQLQLDYASSTGTFGNTDLMANTRPGFCGASSSVLKSGKLNNNDVDDLYCIRTTSTLTISTLVDGQDALFDGYTTTSYADSSWYAPSWIVDTDGSGGMDIAVGLRIYRR